MANNESLRLKHFPPSLTKAAFTWFTTLPPNSVDSWPKLEKLLHEQFYEGHSKISLVPEHEPVQMVAEVLDYSIKKKIDPNFVKSMSQLADRGRHLERLRLEKVRHTKAKGKKEKVAYVDYDDTEPIYEADYISPIEAEIDLAEMKPRPVYECKSLFPSKGKNVSVDNISRFPAKAYTFDISKCEEIFDALVKDGQILVPPNAKLPPLEQPQKRGFYKCHNYLGHPTFQCFLFKDLV
ncbi:uncharacterized protein LOC131635961 [Vicia villosa]|uniref:uncharacterized protein LOC131635961 n=1 Tax=Vicia villosa TaxID=3911 RepID=UPI00273CC39F|nr:uncharacterized protein LOC131635961 [Vicia villosa]